MVSATIQNDIKPVNLRVNDFCQAYGISRTTFYEEIRKGELSVIKVGTRTLVPVDVAEAWQARRLAEARQS